MKYSVLLFDLDDTLYHAVAAYDLALKELGLGWEHPEFISARDSVKQRLPKWHVSARNRLLYFKFWLERKKEFSAHEALRLMGLYETHLQNEVRKQAKALRREALFQELAKKYRMGIVTNENLRTQLIKILPLDPEGKFFPGVITSEEVGVEKPASLPFKRALEFFEVGPSECLFIGDDGTNDIEGATKMGMDTVKTTEFVDSPSQVPPTFTVSRLDELRQLL